MKKNLMAGTLTLLLLSMPLAAAQTWEYLKEGVQSSQAPFQWKGGTALIEVYGSFSGGATVTMQYSSNGKSGDYLNVEPPNLIAATADVRLEAMDMTKGWWFQFVVSGGDSATRLTLAVGVKEVAG